MRKTLYEKYIDSTTFSQRNHSPRNEGIIATLSDIVEREDSFENLPLATEKLHEFNRMFIDKNKVSNQDELEKIATLMTVCLTMMIFDKHVSSKMKK